MTIDIVIFVGAVLVFSAFAFYIGYAFGYHEGKYDWIGTKDVTINQANTADNCEMIGVQINHD